MGNSCWHYPPGYTAFCTIIIVCAFLYSTTGITLSPCGSDNTVDLLETTENNIITCSGIPDLNWQVNWQVTIPGNPGQSLIVGNCAANRTTCTNASAIGYMATRPSSDKSVMIVNPRINWGYVRNATLECQAANSVHTEIQSCQLDIVSLPSTVTCTVRLDTSAVVGSCNVAKVYSYHGRYSCQWYSKQGSYIETPVTPVDMQTTSTADITPTNGTYVNVVCNVTMPKPTEDTSYRVVISPGGVREGAGNITVQTPSSTARPTTTAGGDKTTPDCCWLCLLLVIPPFLPIPLPLPWPGYLIYVLICWCIVKRYRSTGPWHPHYMCGKRTNDVYFSAHFVMNDGRTVLIWSKSPTTGRFVCYGTETTPGANRTGAGREMEAPPSHRNSVSLESGAVKNGNKHTSQKEKNKHTGTGGSPRKSRQPEAPVELTTVRTTSPLQAATVHGDNQASGTPHGDHQASGTPRLRPLPEPSRMTSVERNSTAETSNMLGRDKHPKLPPIGKPDNHP